MRNLEFEDYKSLVKSAPPSSRLRMMKELDKVIVYINNTNRTIRRRLALGAPRASSYGRKIQKVRAKIAHKKKHPRTKTNVSNIFKGLSI